MSSTRAMTWLRAIGLGVLAASVLAGCASPATTVASLAAARSAEPPSTEPPSATATPPTPASDQAIVLTGAAEGAVTGATVTCDEISSSVYAWQLVGELGGEAVDLTFNTNNFTGSASYNVTGITDENGGLMTLAVGDLQFSSNADTVGTFTVDEGQLTGSVAADVSDFGSGQEVHVEGTWACS